MSVTIKTERNSRPIERVEALKRRGMIYKIIHIRTGVKVFVGTLEECYTRCLDLKDGEFVVLPQ